MKERTRDHYAALADRTDGLHLRDVQAQEDRRERAYRASRFTVSDGVAPMTPHTEQWYRNMARQTTVHVTDAWGKDRWITETQDRVRKSAIRLTDRGEPVSMTRIAGSLGIATSSVSRALLRLASMGLVAYDVVRGRYGGVLLFRETGKALQERSQRAWEKLRDMRVKAARRAYDRGMEALRRSGYPMSTFNVASYKSRCATLTAWTATDMAEVDALLA